MFGLVSIIFWETVLLCYAEQTETFTQIKCINNMCGGIYKPKLYWVS